jgi:hypothetical protein
MGELKPKGKRAKQAILWIWIVLVFDMACGISGYMEYNLYQAMAHGVEVPEDVMDANDMRDSVICIFATIAYIISVVTFLKWFRRAYHNLHQTLDHRLAHREGWAVGSWFVPIINLYRPYLIMKELYQKTKEWLTNKGMEQNLTTHSVGWWWALWILSGVIDYICFKLAMMIETETIDEAITHNVMYMISCVMMIPLALITVKIIKDYSKAEALLAGEPSEV